MPARCHQVKLREMAIIDLQKKIAEGDNRLKQQQNLYEAVRSDRQGTHKPFAQLAVSSASLA